MHLTMDEGRLTIPKEAREKIGIGRLLLLEVRD
jgi:bifunctional DNA-binding transcriptional regulator/antitoxin component of YhaV-PrlF toxin-antitoxin module